jgi:hypothetical protein
VLVQERLDLGLERLLFGGELEVHGHLQDGSGNIYDT